MNILKATPNHLSLVTPLFNSYRQFYNQPSDPKGVQSFLHERLVNGDSVIFLAIDNPDYALGFTQLYPSFSSVSMKRLWILNDLFVIPAARKKGVAEALIRQCETLARETNSKGLVLETATDNHPAQNLYKKLDWSKEEEFVQYFKNF